MNAIRQTLDVGYDSLHGYHSGYIRPPLPVFSTPSPVQWIPTQDTTSSFQMLTCNNEACHRLMQQLGATEYELEVLRTHFKELQKELKIKEANWKQDLFDREDCIEEWKINYTTVQEQCDKLQQRSKNLENYFGCLPTAEETVRMRNNMKYLKESRDAEVAENKELKSTIRNLQEEIEDKDSCITALEQKVSDVQQLLKSSMRYCYEMSGCINAELSDLDKDDISKMALKESVTESTKHMVTSYQKMLKVVEARYKYFQGCSAKHQEAVRDLKERLAHEEDTTAALKSATAAQEDTIRLLTDRLRKVSHEKQSLLEAKLILEEELDKYSNETASMDENKKLMRLLLEDGRKCFSELKGLVMACSKISRGDDPELVHLLGLSDENVLEVSNDERHQIQVFLKEVKSLKTDVEKLRNLVADRYAEEISRNVPCILQ